MNGQNIVYVACSLDGFIATNEGGVDWLTEGFEADPGDTSFADFMAGIDALVMGRNTFETVHAFGAWPYDKPVFVLSTSLDTLPEGYEGKASLMAGTPQDITGQLNAKGHRTLYIDGGSVVQSFLRADLIDQLILTRIPIVLGEGIPLFSALPSAIRFSHLTTKILHDQLVQSHYRRRKD